MLCCDTQISAPLGLRPPCLHPARLWAAPCLSLHSSLEIPLGLTNILHQIYTPSVNVGDFSEGASKLTWVSWGLSYNCITVQILSLSNPVSLRLTDLVSERNPHPQKACYMQISESQGLFPRLPPAIVYIYVYMEVGERKEEIWMRWWILAITCGIITGEVQENKAWVSNSFS